MRQDQYERLQQLHEQLTDVFLNEADPAKWPGAAKNPDKLTAKQRGDRYWSKKNAVATIAIMARISNLTDLIQRSSAAGAGKPDTVADEEESLDAQVSEAEREAAKLMKKLQDAGGKAAFDAKVHGKR